MKFKALIRGKLDFLKTLGWNIFAPNFYKHLLMRYTELRDALDARDEEYDAEINLAYEEIRTLKTENEMLRQLVARHE